MAGSIDIPAQAGIFRAEVQRRRVQRAAGAPPLGGGVMVLTSIPIVNFVAMPLAVAGATLLWVEQFQPQSTAT